MLKNPPPSKLSSVKYRDFQKWDRPDGPFGLGEFDFSSYLLK